MKVFNIKAFAHFGIAFVFLMLAHFTKEIFHISDSWTALIFALQVPAHISLFCTKLKPVGSNSVKTQIVNSGFATNIGNSIEISNNENCDININGKRYTGKNITVKGPIAYVDNINVESQVKNITIEGNVKRVSTLSADVHVQGNVERVDTMSGNVTASGSITGKIDTMSGNIKLSK